MACFGRPLRATDPRGPSHIKPHRDRVDALKPNLQSPLSAATKRLRSLFGLGNSGKTVRQRTTPLSGDAFKDILTDMVRDVVLTTEAYDADKDNWQPMSFEKWRAMYLKSYCTFSITSCTLRATFLMRHWEYIVNQSLMFDQDNFLNSLNAMANDYGWLVEGFTPPDQMVSITFYKFRSDTMVRQPPSFIYYFSAAWNKSRILKCGLLPTTSIVAPGGRRVAEYDIMFKSYNLEAITAMARNMFESAIHYSDSNDGTTNFMKLIGFMPITVFRVNTSIIAECAHPHPPPVYDEDAENGTIMSYTSLPAAAFDKIMHEDNLPEALRILEGKSG